MPTIEACLPWNHTNITLEQGKRYRVKVPPGQQCRDASCKCGPDGYTSLLVAAFTPFLRVRRAHGRKARFFTLIGTIGESIKHAFIIGNGTDFTATANGELVCFANDVPWAYFNNRDSIKIMIEPITA